MEDGGGVPSCFYWLVFTQYLQCSTYLIATLLMFSSVSAELKLLPGELGLPRTSACAIVFAGPSVEAM